MEPWKALKTYMDGTESLQKCEREKNPEQTHTLNKFYTNVLMLWKKLKIMKQEDWPA